jgi:acyl-CoA synthetase (AMP-forming)/AMP-acid ligase II
VADLGYRNQGDTLATHRPDHPAIIEYAAGESTSYTFGELDRAIDTLAAELTDHHALGDRIGILGENSAAWLVTFFAAQRAGLVPVPIGYKQHAAQVRYIAEDADLVELFAGPGYEDLAREAATGLPVTLVDHALITGLLEAPRAFTSVVPAPTDSAMFLYTSGSTGNPKGVDLSQASHLWVIERGVGSVDTAGRLLVAAPLYHMNALGMTQRSFAAGQTVVLLPKFQAKDFLRAIAEHEVTDLSGVPPMFAMLLEEPELIASLSLDSVRIIYMSSAPAARELFEGLREVFSDPTFSYRYGTTESGPIAFADPADGRPVPFGSVGVPDPAVDLQLVGPDVETTRTGTLQVRNPALMTGYHNRPDIPSPITADGFYHTKDLFHVDEDGFFFFVGREDDMFASGGENIYPRAVERVLESHPAVSQVSVVPVPDPIKHAKPVAFVVLQPGASATGAELKSHALTHLEAFAHPREIWFVDALPLNAANKVDRNALVEDAKQRIARAA